MVFEQFLSPQGILIRTAQDGIEELHTTLKIHGYRLETTTMKSFTVLMVILQTMGFQITVAELKFLSEIQLQTQIQSALVQTQFHKRLVVNGLQLQLHLSNQAIIVQTIP